VGVVEPSAVVVVLRGMVVGVFSPGVVPYLQTSYAEVGGARKGSNRRGVVHGRRQNGKVVTDAE